MQFSYWPRCNRLQTHYFLGLNGRVAMLYYHSNLLQNNFERKECCLRFRKELQLAFFRHAQAATDAGRREGRGWQKPS